MSNPQEMIHRLQSVDQKPGEGIMCVSLKMLLLLLFPNRINNFEQILLSTLSKFNTKL